MTLRISKEISEIDLINYHQDLRDEEAAGLWKEILEHQFPGIMNLKVWYAKGMLHCNFQENLYSKHEVNDWLSKTIREFKV
jgi:hypothetical protein